MKSIILLACLSGLFSASVVAGISHSKAATDVLCNLPRTEAPQSESTAPRDTSETCEDQVPGEFMKKYAQARIHQFIGKLITVEAGAFEYVDDTVNPPIPPIPRLVKVDHAFQLQENDVSQEQYDVIAFLINGSLQAGEQPMPAAAQAMNPDRYNPHLVGPKKPIGGLTVAQSQRYLTRLNESLAKLWPVAYPGQPVPIMRLPEERELRLAMTDPLPEEEQSTLANGTRITAKFSTYSGTNVPTMRDLTSEQVQELRSHVVYERLWNEGPKEVDDPSIQPNLRGFRGLSGNIYKLTSTLWRQNGLFHVILGGYWYYPRQNCSSASFDITHSVIAQLQVGLRLSRTVP